MADGDPVVDIGGSGQDEAPKLVPIAALLAEQTKRKEAQTARDQAIADAASKSEAAEKWAAHTKAEAERLTASNADKLSKLDAAKRDMLSKLGLQPDALATVLETIGTTAPQPAVVPAADAAPAGQPPPIHPTGGANPGNAPQSGLTAEEQQFKADNPILAYADDAAIKRSYAVKHPPKR